MGKMKTVLMSQTMDDMGPALDAPLSLEVKPRISTAEIPDEVYKEAIIDEAERLKETMDV